MVLKSSHQIKRDRALARFLIWDACLYALIDKKFRESIQGAYDGKFIVMKFRKLALAGLSQRYPGVHLILLPLLEGDKKQIVAARKILEKSQFFCE